MNKPNEYRVRKWPQTINVAVHEDTTATICLI